MSDSDDHPLAPNARVGRATTGLSAKAHRRPLPLFLSPCLGRGIRRIRWRALSVYFVCGLVAFLTLYATQPLLPLLETLFHASKSAVGWTVSASTLGVAISAPLLGMFTERMNRKRVILISIVLLAVPTCAAATSTSLGWLIFWRWLQGLITPGVFATTIAYITENWPPTAVALLS